MNMEQNFGLPNMVFNPFGNITRSVPDVYDEFSPSSSSDSEDDLEIDVNNLVNCDQHTRQSDTVKFSVPESTITITIVQLIEKDLDFYEIISMIFLLYDTELALQYIRIALSHGPDHFVNDKLSIWARTNPQNWRTKLVEALSVIKNYQVLKKLGFSEHDIDSRFQPTKDATLYLDRPKKMLYRVCECLTEDEAEKLVETVRKEANFKDDITAKYKFMYRYLEFYILFWISQGYIIIEKQVCLDNLTRHLRNLGYLYFNIVDEINYMVKSINNSIEERVLNDNMKGYDTDDIYPIINILNVGLCIIINMAQFKKNVEQRKKFKGLLPKEPLSDREGSSEDVASLTETFTALNFVVVEAHDIRHDDLEWQIHKLVENNFKKEEHSMLFLCILSHGGEGIVYAANSVPVSIQDIQNTISGDTPLKDLLGGIPKVIIIQACQGTKPLLVDCEPCVTDRTEATSKLSVDGDLCFDGPDKFIPKYADVLTCMAIIGGYVAVRSLGKGTKYIQELCYCLKKYHQVDHFHDIVTRVHQTLNKDEMHIRNVPKDQRRCKEHDDCLCIYMTPTNVSTLRKKLYLIRKK